MRRGVLNLQLRWFCSVPLVTAWTFLQALLWSQTQAPNSFLDCSRPQNSDGPVSILLAAKEATTVKQLWLESCSQDHKKVIQFQLPPNRCRLTEKNAWQNRCSFSYATRCPEPAWLRKAEETLLSPDRDFAKKLERKGPVAIYVGCNKGMDAVNTLRMLSSSPVIDKNIWRDALVESSRSANRTIHVGHCNQEYASQYALPTGLATAVTTTSQSTPQVINARVFCIEAMPNSAEQLQQTTHHLGWEKSLIVTNAAIAAADGTARFPHRQVGKIVGVESLGLATCQTPGQKRFCTNVPQYKLDTFVRTVVDDFSESYFATPIDFLTIDVEGFDWDVLLGANDTLRRVKYLEFEYNWKGSWKQQILSFAIDSLQSRGFVCYWAGSGGNLWRITNCWMDYYNLKFWSNVACVHQHLAESLLRRMEDLFRQTLAAGRAIRYHNASSANTDGRMQWDYHRIFGGGSDGAASVHSNAG